MKNIFNILIFAVMLISMVSCDKIEESERFSEAADITTNRKVLVEEFTGQFCPNCVLGHQALESILSKYGEHAVVVGIHAGELADDDPTTGLKAPEGDAYAHEYGIQYYPSAVVNRNGKVLSERSAWQGAVFSAARQQQTVSIDLKAHIEDGKIIVDSKLASLSGSCTANYQLWVTESGIKTFQLNGDDYILDYVHNHVFRAAVNGTSGESTTFNEVPQSLTHSISLSERWNKDNLQIVAFLYDKNGVLQAEEAKVE